MKSNTVSFLLLALLCTLKSSEASMNIDTLHSDIDGVTDTSMGTDSSRIRVFPKNKNDAGVMHHFNLDQVLARNQAIEEDNFSTSSKTSSSTNTNFSPGSSSQVQQYDQKQNENLQTHQTFMDEDDFIDLTEDEIQNLINEWEFEENLEYLMNEGKMEESNPQNEAVQLEEAEELEDSEELEEASELEGSELEEDEELEEESESDYEDVEDVEEEQVMEEDQVETYEEMFGDLYEDGDYTVPENAAINYDADLEIQFWDHLVGLRFDEAANIADNLQITPRSNIYYLALSYLLEHYSDDGDQSAQMLQFVYERYPDLFRYRCASDDENQQNVFVKANQAAIDYITTYAPFVNDDMVLDRVIEAAVMIALAADEDGNVPEGMTNWMLPDEFFNIPFELQDAMKRTIMVASNASNDQPNYVLRKAYNAFYLRDYFYPDGETIATRAMKLGRGADLDCIIDSRHWDRVMQLPNTRGENPGEIYETHFPEQE